MAVVAASLMTLRPGAYEAFLDEHKKMKPLLETAGARNVRLLGTIGGPGGGGALAVSFEFDDYASYGKFMDTTLTTPEILAGLTAVGSEQSPIASVQSSVWSVIDE